LKQGVIPLLGGAEAVDLADGPVGEVFPQRMGQAHRIGDRIQDDHQARCGVLVEEPLDLREEIQQFLRSLPGAHVGG